MKSRIVSHLLTVFTTLTFILLTGASSQATKAQSCPPYEGAKMRRHLYAGAPYEGQGTAQIAVVNTTNQRVTIQLYHPDDPNPGQRPFSSTVIEPGQNAYLGPHYYGADWGIQVDQSCIRYVGQVSDWNLFGGKYIFQTWPTRIISGVKNTSPVGSSSVGSSSGSSSGSNVRASSVVELALPYVEPQNDSWSCGPNSATRLLLYYAGNPNAITYDMVKHAANTQRPEIMQITGLGTTPHALRDTIKIFRQDISLKRETDLSEIINALRAKKPVIALLRVGSKEVPVAVMGKGTIVGGVLDKVGARPNVTLTYPRLHWVTIHGVNLETKQLLIQNTNGQDDWMSIDEFYKKWNWSVGAGAVKAALDAEAVTTRTILY